MLKLNSKKKFNLLSKLLLYKFLLFPLLMCFSEILVAQSDNFYGLIKNTSGEAMPYANVIVLGKSTGTSTNFDGEYSLQLSPGSYRIGYQFVGYKSQIQEVSIKNEEKYRLDIVLEEEKLYLNTVVVKANAENPAYAIIRSAQKMRKTYLREHENISYESYTKLFGKASKTSNSLNLFGTILSPEEGIFYLSESVSSFNKYNADEKSEKLEASLILGDSVGYSKNNSVFIELYENYPLAVRAGNVVNRIISPISTDAFAFYDFDFLGSIEEGNLLLHKIKIIPRSKGSNTFAGEIYIADKSWRLFKSNLVTNNPFLGNVEIITTYIQDDERETFLPFSMSFILQNESEDVDIYQHNLFYDYQFDVPIPDTGKQANYIVNDAGLQKSPEWWKNKRPIALTVDEQNAYNLDIKKEENDQLKTTSSDSLISTPNTVKVSPFRAFQKVLQTNQIPLSNLIALKFNFFTYNTVEGAVLKPHFVRQQELPNGKRLNTELVLRYGFASKNFYGKTGFTYELNPSKLARFRFEAGYYIEQISGNTSISDFINMGYSLEQRRNYQKLYGRDYLALKWGQELFNGFDLALESSYNNRQPLENNTDYSWNRKSEREYMPNQPIIQGNFETFEKNNLWESRVIVNYQYNRAYDMIMGRKIALSSKFPVVSMGFDLGVWESDYSRYWFNISDVINMGPVGFSRISASYGQFLTSSNLTPIDYFHFMGNQTIFHQNEKEYGLAYQLLDYYNYSTADYFGGANFEHDFGNAIFGRVPLIKKLGLNTYVMGNYLQSGNTQAYSELGFGLSSTYLPFRFNYYFGFEGNDYSRHGFIMYTNF